MLYCTALHYIGGVAVNEAVGTAACIYRWLVLQRKLLATAEQAERQIAVLLRLCDGAALVRR